MKDTDDITWRDIKTIFLMEIKILSIFVCFLTYYLGEHKFNCCLCKKQLKTLDCDVFAID